MSGRLNTPSERGGTLLIQRARPGDFLESLPLLFRAKAYGGPLGLLCSPEIASWARDLSLCDRLLTLPGVHPEEGFSGGYPKWRSMVGELRDGHWERVVHLNHDPGGMALLSASAIRSRYGFLTMLDGSVEGSPGRCSGWPLYLVSSARGMRQKNRLHLSDVWREFLPAPEPFPGGFFQNGVETPSGATGPVILVLSGRSAYRQLTLETLSQISRGIIERTSLPVLLVGRPDEGSLGESISRFCGPGVRNLAGKTSIGELDELIAQASLVISPDTATLHLASFRGKPTIGLFFGGASPHETGARFGRRVSLVPRMDCHPCAAEGSGCQTIACRERMRGDLIARIALAILENAPLPTVSPDLLLWEGRDGDGGFNVQALSGNPLEVGKGNDGEDELLGILFRRFFLRFLPGQCSLDPLSLALGSCRFPFEDSMFEQLERLEAGVRLYSALESATIERRVACAKEFPIIWPIAHHLLLSGDVGGEEAVRRDGAFSGMLSEIDQMLDWGSSSGLPGKRRFSAKGELCHVE